MKKARPTSQSTNLPLANTLTEREARKIVDTASPEQIKDPPSLELEAIHVYLKEALKDFATEKVRSRYNTLRVSVSSNFITFVAGTVVAGRFHLLPSEDQEILKKDEEIVRDVLDTSVSHCCLLDHEMDIRNWAQYFGVEAVRKSLNHVEVTPEGNIQWVYNPSDIIRGPRESYQIWKNAHVGLAKLIIEQQRTANAAMSP